MYENMRGVLSTPKICIFVYGAIRKTVFAYIPNYYVDACLIMKSLFYVNYKSSSYEVVKKYYSTGRTYSTTPPLRNSFYKTRLLGFL